MTPRRFALLSGIAMIFALAGTANAATMYTFGGAGDPSLHGSSGSLAITDLGGGNYTVVWEINTAGFDDAGAIATGHSYLTDVAFKISGMTNVTLNTASVGVGTLYYPSNVNSGTNGCDTGGSPAGFACVILAPMIDATTDQVFSVTFDVTGNLDLSEGVAYRGKYGTDDGWVISETGVPIPEPSAALVFGLGALIVGGRSRRR